MKILVVDDSKLARKTLIRTLKKTELEADILEAENGAIALEVYKNDSPDIVFLDLTMPVMDGYEALEEIIKINPEAQVVVVTADIQPEARLRVLRLGAREMCPKPINDDKMRYILEEVIII